MPFIQVLKYVILWKLFEKKALLKLDLEWPLYFINQLPNSMVLQYADGCKLYRLTLLQCVDTSDFFAICINSVHLK